MDILRRVFRILVTGYIVKVIRNLISGKSSQDNKNDSDNKRKVVSGIEISLNKMNCVVPHNLKCL